MTNIGLDCLIILLPLPTLWKLTLPLQRKIGLVFVFGLGMLLVRELAMLRSES